MTSSSLICLLSLALTASDAPAGPAPNLDLPRLDGVKPRSMVFILVDDHRFDAMSCMNHPFLKTPTLDRLANEGVHFENAFVTTSLCSPSRASILTGQYAHKHKIINNYFGASKSLVYFPQYLQKIGYKTAFIGKWHMGHDSDEPRRGFDYWVSFRGQGSYLPNKSGLNVNGKRVKQAGYITDVLTEYAVDWLKKQSDDQPFFLYLSHKAVHANFTPAKRHQGKYKDVKFTPPASQANTKENFGDKPRWVKDQRNSWHGVDFPYHSKLDIGEYYKRYCETLLAVDESVARVLKTLEEKKLLNDTLVMYMGDNGFCFGEKGLIDKRTAYETSMRVPLMAYCPALFKEGSKVKQVVANIDIGPTMLEAAGLKTPKHMDGQSFLQLPKNPTQKWRDALLYEYYWERNFPQTPTMHAIRTDKYKYIHYYGLWDCDELFDLSVDPKESKNLINDPSKKKLVKELSEQLFDILEETNGMYIPLYRDRGGLQNLRNPEGSKVGSFPPWLFKQEKTKPAKP